MKKYVSIITTLACAAFVFMSSASATEAVSGLGNLGGLVLNVDTTNKKVDVTDIKNNPVASVSSVYHFQQAC